MGHLVKTAKLTFTIRCFAKEKFHLLQYDFLQQQHGMKDYSYYTCDDIHLAHLKSAVDHHKVPLNSIQHLTYPHLNRCLQARIVHGHI